MLCPKCKGAGEFHHINDYGGFSSLERLKCWACQGTGNLPEGTVFVSNTDLIRNYADSHQVDPAKIIVTHP